MSAIRQERPARAKRLLVKLKVAYPQGLTLGLASTNPFEYLVATVLATQCKDERVNKITPALFARYPDPAAFAAADYDELLPLVRPTGLGPTKARNLMAIGRLLLERHAGKVPATMAELTALPGWPARSPIWCWLTATASSRAWRWTRMCGASQNCWG